MKANKFISLSPIEFSHPQPEGVERRWLSRPPTNQLPRLSMIQFNFRFLFSFHFPFVRGKKLHEGSMNLSRSQIFVLNHGDTERTVFFFSWHA
jgi:hypothetical protein